jgi:diguanylate cyclase (GGDEF)-like protein
VRSNLPAVPGQDQATILIVEDEDDIARLIEMGLSEAGYAVHRVATGEDAVERARQLRPDLIVLDVNLPGIDGVEVTRQLRGDTRTAGCGIIMLTARTLSADRLAGLAAGADDYVDKPFDPEELTARVHAALRRAKTLRGVSPLTGLPGNFEIQARIEERIEVGEPFAVLHADLDTFKAYNDHYGFVRGDAAIVFTARIVEEAVLAAEEPGTFLGHIGGDDFAIVCPAAAAVPLCEAIIGSFDEAVPALYDEEDRQRRFIQVTDRRGWVHTHPFLTMSIGVASTSVRPLPSSTEAAAGSTYRIDRRRVT